MESKTFFETLATAFDRYDEGHLQFVENSVASLSEWTTCGIALLSEIAWRFYDDIDRTGLSEFFVMKAPVDPNRPELVAVTRLSRFQISEVLFNDLVSVLGPELAAFEASQIAVKELTDEFNAHLLESKKTCLGLHSLTMFSCLTQRKQLPVVAFKYRFVLI